jgi:hypothetical protein
MTAAPRPEYSSDFERSIIANSNWPDGLSTGILEIVEDRYEARSIIVTSQLPVDRWYEIIRNPTIADAILDRLVHNAYRIEFKGESLRKQKQSAPDQSVT